jgi:hypothetical protein
VRIKIEDVEIETPCLYCRGTGLSNPYARKREHRVCNRCKGHGRLIFSGKELFAALTEAGRYVEDGHGHCTESGLVAYGGKAIEFVEVEKP